MKINYSQKIFKDKNGIEIKAGDVLLRKFIARMREYPGRKIVTVNSMSSRELIIPDEGKLLNREEHWVKYHVTWSGACLIAERGDCSDFQILIQSELFDYDGNKICEGSGFHYFNEVFDSTQYEIVK